MSVKRARKGQYRAKPALTKRMIQLHGGQKWGYVRHACYLAQEAGVRGLPARGYMERILSANSYCPGALAMALTRAAEERPAMTIEETTKLVSKYFTKEGKS